MQKRVSSDFPERCAPAMQTTVLAVDESFKVFRFKKQANRQVEQNAYHNYRRR